MEIDINDLIEYLRLNLTLEQKEDVLAALDRDIIDIMRSGIDLVEKMRSDLDM